MNNSYASLLTSQRPGTIYDKQDHRLTGQSRVWSTTTWVDGMSMHSQDDAIKAMLPSAPCPVSIIMYDLLPIL